MPTHQPFKKGETSSAEGGPRKDEPAGEEFNDFEALNIDEDDYAGGGVPGAKEVEVPGFDRVKSITPP